MTPEYRMEINHHKVDELSKLNLDGGMDGFRAILGKIHLPADKRQWPDLRIVERANKFRRIQIGKK